MNAVKLTLVAAALLVNGVAMAEPSSAVDQERQGYHHRGGAFHGGGMKGQMLDRLSAKVDLTQAQRDAIQAVIDSTQPETQRIRTAMRENRKALRELVQGGNADEAAVRELAEVMGGHRPDCASHPSEVRDSKGAE